MLTDLENGEISWFKIRAIITSETKCDYYYKLARILNRLCAHSVFESKWKEKRDMKNLGSNIADIAYLWAISDYSGNSFRDDDESFSSWMRFIFNMVHNTVDSFDSLVRFIKRCSNHYAFHSHEIIAWLADPKSLEIEDHSEQWEEERFKAAILYKSDKTQERDIILQAEGHPLFEGRIRPILTDEDLYKDNSSGMSISHIEKRWNTFSKYFSESGAKPETAVETFSKLFSYINSYNQLWWNYYVFENTTDVWKNKIFKLKNFYYSVACLLHKDNNNSEIKDEAIRVLCAPEVLEKVLSDNRKYWYIRNPDISLRPNGDMWCGIRLFQDNIKASVDKLMCVDGLEFESSENKYFYKTYGLVWGVRISFKYRNVRIQLWDNCDIWIENNWLKDDRGSNIRIYQYDGNLKKLLDDFLDKLNDPFLLKDKS